MLGFLSEPMEAIKWEFSCRTSENPRIGWGSIKAWVVLSLVKAYRVWESPSKWSVSWFCQRQMLGFETPFPETLGYI